MRALAPALLLALAACAPRPATAPTPAPVAAPTPALAPAPPTRDTTSSVGALRRVVDSLLAAPQWRNAQWGILVVDPARHDTLVALQPGKLFMPGSNMKVVTGAVGLAQLGADYRWRTTFATRGPVVKGTLRGDLLVVGRGDPTVSDRMRGDAMTVMRDLADSLAAHGITRIEGRLLSAGNALPGPAWGFGWSWDEFDEYYSAPTDELELNEGSSTYHLTGGARPGAAVSVRLQPDASWPPTANRLTTASSPGPADAPRAVYDSTTGGYALVGALRPRETATIDVAHHDAPAAYLAALRATLAARKVTVGGHAPRDTTGAVDTLFTLESPPLREVMPAMMKKSQNQVAELLLKTLGLEKTGVGRADSGVAVVRRQLRDWGADTAGLIMRDGSGLSRYDYVSPATMVTILEAMHTSPDFQVWYDALPIAGVDGTLANRMKGTPAQANAHAKTGYVSQARSLTGYVTTSDRALIEFSILCNNFSVPVRAVEAVQDAIVAELARMSLLPLPATQPAAPGR